MTSAASLSERLIQAAVDYESGRCSSRELAEARAAVESAIHDVAQPAPRCARCNGDQFISGDWPDLPDEPCPICNSDAPSGAERVRLTAAQPPAAPFLDELRAFCRPLLGDVNSANDQAFERLLQRHSATGQGSLSALVDRAELVSLLEDLASVNLSREAVERQARRMADDLIARGLSFGAKSTEVLGLIASARYADPTGTAENAWNDALEHIEEALAAQPPAAPVEKCTICAAEESPGFYTGCMVKDGHAPEWDCDGKGNLTRNPHNGSSADTAHDPHSWQQVAERMREALASVQNALNAISPMVTIAGLGDLTEKQMETFRTRSAVFNVARQTVKEALTLRAIPTEPQPTSKSVKLCYVKRWRTLVELPEKYADEIVEALRPPQARSTQAPREGLAAELTAFHDACSMDSAGGDGQFRILCSSGSSDQARALRAVLREAATALSLTRPQSGGQ